ncbi:unnamed protein product [Pleuronectes platessa]|uniref:Uncharacterized protein n=1 Tax=Pleuronectes platessa TaxID=8262 RepID=A0A9N7VR91_PLEPL|nr:unnamed protein product [Pleuronectes platessa]
MPALEPHWKPNPECVSHFATQWACAAECTAKEKTKKGVFLGDDIRLARPSRQHTERQSCPQHTQIHACTVDGSVIHPDLMCYFL